MITTKKIKLIILVVSMAFIVTGCATKFTVNHYPAFYNPSIKSIAVLPFENETSRKGAGIAVASHLSAALAANETYKVTGPVRLEQILKEKEMPALQKSDYRAIVKELAGLDRHQAFITGRVLSESFMKKTIEYYGDYDFFYDAYPYWYYPYWNSPRWPPYYYEYEREAYISVDVSIVGVPDGKALDTASIKATADVGGIPASLKKYAGQMVLNKLSEKIVSNFAVVPMKITVYPDKAMRTADSFEQDKWHFTKTFGSDREFMYVVLCLPGAAAMNQFELAITPQDNPSNIISSKDFTWERDKYCQSVEFSPRQIALSNGPGKYSVHFISRGKVVLTRHFKIK